MSPAGAVTRHNRFADRGAAGRCLAERLERFTPAEPVVVALPRGGVPVGVEVAKRLGAPVEVFGVRKLGAPHNPEYGIGAIAEDGTKVIDVEAVAVLGISNGQVDSIVEREAHELQRRVDLYRGDAPLLDLRGKLAIVVDDGAATGGTDTAALRAIRRRGPERVVLAVPVCPLDSAERLRDEADEVVCLFEPDTLDGVGSWYEDFSQVSDAEVLDLVGIAGPG